MTKMKTLRFLEKEQGMIHQAPQEEGGDPRQVPKEAEVATTPQLGEMIIVSRTTTESSTATTLLHLEEMNLGMQGQGQTPLFQGVSQDLELPRILEIDVMTPAIIKEWTRYLIEQGTLTPLGKNMRGILPMMLRQHHQKPLLDPEKDLQDLAAVMRGIPPGPQLRQLLAKKVR